MDNKYFVGLDIGTNSVGWAVTDDQYNLHKFKGHKMWGARLFNQANTAAERRGYRSTRRGVERKKQRIKLLEEIFADEISVIDPGFYQRIEDSKFFIEDKKIKEKHILFVGNDYDDIKYYHDYPTIYHLRDHLMNSDKKEDIRLIYLACHHILKHRGHFLYQGAKFNRSESLESSLKEVLNHPEVISGIIDDQESLIRDLLIILLEKKLAKKDKKLRIKGVISSQSNIDKNIYCEVLNLCIGSSVKLSKILGEDVVSKEEKSFSFQNTVYEDIRDELELEIGNKIDLIDTCKRVYDGIILSEIIEENQTVSQSKIKSYNKHKEDLKKLKEFIRKNMDKNIELNDYKKIFRVDEARGNNYINYIGKSKNGTKSSAQEFYKYLKKIITEYKDSKIKEEILEEIELGQFLPLQKQKENSVIPYQMHKEELDIILEKASKHYDFLNTEENNITNKEKIISILEFRIPYYVGPLNNAHNKFSWLKKKGTEPIRPWNFEEIVDERKSAKEFIGKLTNKCSFLRTEDVLPKHSLLYSEFRLLNEINTMTCDGRRLSFEEKKKFIEDNFKNPKDKRKITKKRILDWFVINGLATRDSVIAGIDNEIKSDLKSYRDLKSILENNFEWEMCEEIIRLITLFGETKRLLRKEIEEKYGNRLSKGQIERILRLRYKDWGRLSKKFLTKICSTNKINHETDKPQNIISIMRSEAINLNEVLANGNGYDKEIEKIRLEQYSAVEKVSYKLLEEMNISPAVKRSMWQTILLMEEIKKIEGSDPNTIFLEMTRENEDEKKKQRNASKRNSRKEQLIQLYKNCKECTSDWADELKTVDEDRLRSKKLYLYYLQCGKSAYSDEIIDIHDLMTNDTKYNIDHIWPRSRTKDDSFDNLVLCLKSENETKADNYPIDPVIREKKQYEWNRLYRNGFMSGKKYERLMRREGFKKEELAGFINRQLVETSQSTKAIADVLKRIYPKTEIVYVKASNVTEFRYSMYKENNKNTGLFYKYPKNRLINDFHHAQDAYLNIVVGNVYNCKFTKNPANFIENTDKKYQSLTALYKYEIKRGNYIAWIPGDKGSQKVIKKEMDSNDVRITKKLEEESKGGLFNATIEKAAKIKDKGYLPLKGADERLANMNRYGGYGSITIAYYSIYSYTIKKKNSRLDKKIKIGFVPLYLKEKLDSNEEKLKFFKKTIKLRKNESIMEMKILYPKLRSNNKVKLNGMYYRLGGKTDNNICIDNAISLIVDPKWSEYSKGIDQVIRDENSNRIKLFSREDNLEFFDYLRNKILNKIYRHRNFPNRELFASEKTRETFINLDLQDQLIALSQIINVLTNKKVTLSLDKIGVKISRLRFSNDLNKLQEFIIIEESVTGLYEKRVKIISGE